MKRFYKKVSSAKAANGFNILLDGRPIKTPNKAELTAPSQKLADLAAAEWDAQEETIEPNSMPVTQLLNTKIDRVTRDRADMEVLVCNYIDTDLLCYRAEKPEELVKRQNDLWQRWLDNFSKKHNVIFQTTTGLAALKQADQIHGVIKNETRAMDDDRFTILQMLTPACGSIILASAFVNGEANEDDVLACAFLEENYKYDLYNEDVHGGDPLTEKKKKSLKADLDAARNYLDALS